MELPLPQRIYLNDGMHSYCLLVCLRNLLCLLIQITNMHLIENYDSFSPEYCEFASLLKVIRARQQSRLILFLNVELNHTWISKPSKWKHV